MKIAIIAACPFPWPRGTPLRIFGIAETLANRGHDVHVICYHLGEEVDSPFRIHRISDVPGYRKTSPGPSFQKFFKLNPSLIKLTKSLHREIRFEVAHAMHYEGMLVASRALPDIPIVYDAHTTLAGELPDYFPSFLKPVFKLVGKKLDVSIPKKASHIVSVSESISETLLQNGAITQSGITTIPNGVRYELFAPCRNDNPDRHTIIFTGNDAPYQRIDLLIDGFALALKSVPELRLVIVGNCEFRAAHQQVAELDITDSTNIINCPFSEQIELLANASVAVSPRTVCDGLPQKLLNYMAAGKAIIACIGSAGPIEDGVTGLSITNDDPQAMAKAMIEFSLEPERAGRLGKAAAALVRTEYSWEAATAKIEKVYESLINEDAQR